MSDIGTAVERASAYLRDHPGEARYRDSHARARLGDGLRVDVDGPSGERLSTDMPQGIGGGAPGRHPVGTSERRLPRASRRSSASGPR